MNDRKPWWDFFIVHAGADTRLAERLFELLAGYEVFLDSKCLQPGDPWDDALLAAQYDSKITVILISENTDKAYYQREEIANAIAMAHKSSSQHRVVPLVLSQRSGQDLVVPYGLRRLHKIYLTDSRGIEVAAEELKQLVRKRSAARPQTLATVVPSNVRTSRHWSPFAGTVAEVKFRLISEHSIKYIREEGVVSYTVRLLVNEREEFRQRASAFAFASIKHPFSVEGVQCVFECKFGFTLLWARVKVGGHKVL